MSTVYNRINIEMLTEKHELIANNPLSLCARSEVDKLNLEKQLGLSVAVVDSNLNRTFVAELLSLGYAPTQELVQAIMKLKVFEITIVRNGSFPILQTMKGADRIYVPLFKKFPHDVPDENLYFFSRVFSFMSKVMDYTPEDYTELSCGCKIDSALFDIDDSGACPVCQFSDESLQKEVAGIDLKGKEKLKPVVLKLGSYETVCNHIRSTIGSKSSIKESDTDFIKYALQDGVTRKIFDFKDLVPDIIHFKEILALVCKIHIANSAETYSILGDSLKPMVRTATDVLRFAAALSTHDCMVDGTGNEVALDKSVFKLNNKARKVSLYLLDGLNNPLEDMNRYRSTWIRFAKAVHSGSYAKQFPDAVEYIDVLRNRADTIETFNGKLESLMHSKNVDALCDLLSKRPGEFARRLDFILRKHKDKVVVDQVLASFKKVGKDVSTKALIQARNNFTKRNHSIAVRVVVPNGSPKKTQILPDVREKLSNEVCGRVVEVIDHCLKQKFNQKGEPLGNVFIDESLKDLKVPLLMRTNVKTLNNVERGSVIHLDSTKDIVRFFTHWNVRGIDLDLSTGLYDENFQMLDECTYYHTTSGFAQHSGDIQSGPGAEFIDINMGSIEKKFGNARYIAAMVNSYTGQAFDEYTPVCGVMYRSSSEKGTKHFDVNAVKEKFDMTGEGNASIPYIIDLKNKTMVWANISQYGLVITNLESLQERVIDYMKGIVAESECHMTLYDLYALHASINGKSVNKVLAKGEQYDTLLTRDITSVEVTSEWF